jgi:tRNA-guanine family transglycosylase
MTRELSVFRLLSLHNLTYTLGLMRETREAVTSGRFADHHAAVVARRANGATG